MKIEAGKTYKTRGGELVTVSVHGSHCWPFAGGNGKTYTDEGLVFPGAVSPGDLVELVEDAGDFAEVPAAPAGLTLEVGKTYVDRWNQHVTVWANPDPDKYHPYRGSNGRPYTANGRVSENGEILPADLVCVATELRLEVGKTYVTRSGDPVKIVSKDDHPTWPFDGSNGSSFAQNGCEGLDGENLPGDLIAELQEPKAVEAAPEKISLLSAESLDAIMLALIVARTSETPAEIADAFLALADARAKR